MADVMRARALKELVADVIAERLKGSGHSGSWERVRKVPGVRDVEVKKVSELKVQVRVSTEHQGTHWYEVTVKESL